MHVPAVYLLSNGVNRCRKFADIVRPGILLAPPVFLCCLCRHRRGQRLWGEHVADKPPVPLPPGTEAAERQSRPGTLTPFGAGMERALLAVTRSLIEAAPELDELDSRQSPLSHAQAVQSP